MSEPNGNFKSNSLMTPPPQATLSTSSNNANDNSNEHDDFSSQESNSNTNLPPSTTTNTSTSSPMTLERKKYLKVKEKLRHCKIELKTEKESKIKLYKGLIKLASELKQTKGQLDAMKLIQSQEDKTWYQGGMWRGPELLPSIAAKATQQQQQLQLGQTLQPTQPPALNKEAVSLSDLFFDLVIVTAFTRVGLAIQDTGSLHLPQFFYFVIFWLIWGKEASFSTRFDTTDLSSQMSTLLTCFAVLFGSLGSKSDFDSGECTSVMVVALFVALLHFFLHLRVWFWFHGVSPVSQLVSVKEYAVYVMLLTGMEALAWVIGICLLPQESEWRWVVFAVAIVLSFRLPRTFLPNDFHAACSKRGVLFILTLGFIMQSIILVASPFFDYQTPSVEQFFFLGLPCFLLFCVKLLYVDDSFSVDPKDHALLVNRVAGFFFHIGQLSLLLSTTILGGGLNLLTHNYLAGIAALPNNAKALVSGGFSGVILSIGFIKSMHIRRFPTNPSHRHLFFAAYGMQVVVLLAVSYTTISLSLDAPGFLGQASLNEIQLLMTLCLLCLFLLVISWLDEAVELNLYGEADATEFRVHPFGLWTCLKSGDPKPPIDSGVSTRADRRLSTHLSPLLTSNHANLFDSQTFEKFVDIERNYGSLLVNVTDEDDEERPRKVRFDEELGGEDSEKVSIVV